MQIFLDKDGVTHLSDGERQTTIAAGDKQTAEKVAQFAAEVKPASLPVPEAVTMFQARAALMQAGLFEAVDAHCKVAGGIVFQAWEYANHCYRDSELVRSLGSEFDLSSEQIDALFIAADQVKA
jgi:hypothetical protein